MPRAHENCSAYSGATKVHLLSTPGSLRHCLCTFVNNHPPRVTRSCCPQRFAVRSAQGEGMHLRASITCTNVSICIPIWHTTSVSVYLSHALNRSLYRSKAQQGFKTATGNAKPGMLYMARECTSCKPMRLTGYPFLQTVLKNLGTSKQCAVY